MAKKKRDDPPPMQWTPVEVTPLPATAEERDRHLGGFIATFIAPPARDRWAHCLLEKPEKACGHMHRFDRDHEPLCCLELKGADGFPQSLAAIFVSAVGLYFDGAGPACQMTAAEAATVATQGYRDALLSLEPGKRALFFHHEGGVWRCEWP